MPLMAASCLTDQRVTPKNVRQIDDVKLMKNILS